MMKGKVVMLLFICMHLVVCALTGYAQDVQVFAEEGWPPITFSEDGKGTGLGVEAVREMLDRMDMPDIIEVVPWARGWKMLTEYQNVVLFTMTRTPEREAMFTMVGPVAIGTTNFYAKKGSGITIDSLEEAKQVESVGVYTSAVEEQILTKEGFKNLDPAIYPTQTAKKLMRDRITLWCNANLTVGKILNEAGYTVDDVENVFTITENHLYLAFSQGTSEEMITQWMNALKAIKADGTFARIYEKWLPGETPPETVERIGL